MEKLSTIDFGSYADVDVRIEFDADFKRHSLNSEFWGVNKDVSYIQVKLDKNIQVFSLGDYFDQEDNLVFTAGEQIPIYNLEELPQGFKYKLEEFAASNFY